MNGLLTVYGFITGIWTPFGYGYMVWITLYGLSFALYFLILMVVALPLNYLLWISMNDDDPPLLILSIFIFT
jgi:hypothetical protein